MKRPESQACPAFVIVCRKARDLANDRRRKSWFRPCSSTRSHIPLRSSRTLPTTAVIPMNFRVAYLGTFPTYSPRTTLSMRCDSSVVICLLHADCLQINVLDLATPPASLKPRSLVRFDGMVQDTACSPEIYLSKRANGEVGGWGLHDQDHAGGDDSTPVDYSLLRECNVVWAVSIPGQTPWCTSGSKEAAVDSKPQLPHKYPHPSAPHLGVQLKVGDTLLQRLPAAYSLT